MPTSEQALLQGRRYLKARGIANYSQEAAWLLAPDKKLTPSQARRFRRLLQKRGRHYPLQYLLGSQFFCGLELKTPPGVLIPRPETEKLVEVAVGLLNNLPLPGKKRIVPLHFPSERFLRQSPVVWDLGAGTGAIALAVKKTLPRAKVYASDQSRLAVQTARANARRCHLKIKILQGDLFSPVKRSGLTGKIDLLLCNPPYVTDQEMTRLPRDVRHEPALALRGGPDGLDFYRKLIPQAKIYLKAGGGLVLETSPATFRGVKKLLERSGCLDVRLHYDDQKKPRVLSAIVSSPRPVSSPCLCHSREKLVLAKRGRGSMSQAVRSLKNGGVVIFPTDTVYGLGAAYDDARAVAKIFKLKARPKDKPLPILISGPAQLKKLGVVLTPLAKKYIKKHWPGPVTLILPTKKILSPLISKGNTVALRQPDHPLALALIKRAGVPLAATSANLSGSPAPAAVADIPTELKNSADFVLDAGPCPLGRPSTIIDLTVDPPAIIRS